MHHPSFHSAIRSRWLIPVLCSACEKLAVKPACFGTAAPLSLQRALGLAALSYHCECWVAFTELQFSYHNPETILSTVYPYSGNLNQVLLRSSQAEIEITFLSSEATCSLCSYASCSLSCPAWVFKYPDPHARYGQTSLKGWYMGILYVLVKGLLGCVYGVLTMKRLISGKTWDEGGCTHRICDKRWGQFNNTVQRNWTVNLL